MPKILILHAQIDQEWGTDLLHYLQSKQITSSNSVLYPEISPLREIVSELNKIDTLLVIVSPETALGGSADACEAWWRKALERGLAVIPVVAPNAPAGAKNWMPYDLLQEQPIFLAQAQAHETLYERILAFSPADLSHTPNLLQANAQPDAVAHAPTTSPIEEEPTIATTSNPSTNPAASAPPPPPAEAAALPDLAREAPRMGFFNYVLSIVAGFVLVMMIWGAALQESTPEGSPLILWLGGTALVVGSLFALGQIELKRRQRRQLVQNKYREAQGYARSAVKPRVYVEIIESSISTEQGLVWAMRGEAFIIGKHYSNGLPLVAHKALETNIAMIYFDDGVYYLENISEATAMTLVDHILSPREVAAISNGDLIQIPGITVQFRYEA